MSERHVGMWFLPFRLASMDCGHFVRYMFAVVRYWVYVNLGVLPHVLYLYEGVYFRCPPRTPSTSWPFAKSPLQFVVVVWGILGFITPPQKKKLIFVMLSRSGKDLTERGRVLGKKRRRDRRIIHSNVTWARVQPCTLDVAILNGTMVDDFMSGQLGYTGLLMDNV